MKLKRFAPALLPPLLLGVLFAATRCQDRLVHAFGGYIYDQTNDCLYNSGAVTVISGPDPGQCPQLRCWLSSDGTIFVTDEACDAPVDYVDQTQATSGPCVKALADYAAPNHDPCANPPEAGLGFGGGVF